MREQVTPTADGAERGMGCARSRRLVLWGVLACLPAGGALGVDGEVWNMTAEARLFAGLPNRVVLRGSMAYAALDTGVQVLDLAEPRSPRVVANLYLPGPALDLALDGELLCVADGEAGIALVDVTDPAAPVPLGQLATSLPARAVALADGRAYVGVGSPGGDAGALWVLDLSDPRAPAVLGLLGIDSGVSGVAVAGEVAYLAVGGPSARRNGLLTVDLAQPGLPRELPRAYLPSLAPANRVLLDGGTLYLAAGQPSVGQVQVVSLADPREPVALSALALPDGAMDLSLGAGRLLVAAREYGLRTIDVGDPSRPFDAGGMPLGGRVVAVTGAGMAAIAGVRATNGACGLAVLDLGRPVGGWQVGSLPQAQATDVAVDDGRAYLLENDALYLADLEPGAAPVVRSRWGLARGDYTGLAVEGSLALVAEDADIHVLDVTDPDSPRRVARLQLSARVQDMVLRDRRLYAVKSSGLEIFDLSDPARPIALGGWSALTLTTAFALEGSTGYLVDGDELLVLDLARPGWPRALGRLSFPGEWLYGVSAEGGRVALTGATHRLHLVDASDPTAPSLLGSLSGAGLRVRLAGDRATVAAGPEGVRVIDLSLPGSPREVAALDTSGSAVNLALAGNQVLVAGLEAQHWLLDGIPSAAELVASAARGRMSAGGLDGRLADAVYVPATLAQPTAGVALATY